MLDRGRPSFFPQGPLRNYDGDGDGNRNRKVKKQ